MMPDFSIADTDEAKTVPLAEPESAKVTDIESFRPFVQRMARSHESGSMSRDDAIFMAYAVARARKLGSNYDQHEVQAVVESAFPENPAHEGTCIDQTVPLSDGGRPQGIITADQLQLADFAPPLLVVPPFIAEGVTLLAGKPKLGKSWLMLDLARAVASGTEALGGIPVLPGQVLGLFLEDSERRLQARLRKLDANPCRPWPSELSLTTQWSRFDEGGLADIEAWCRQIAEPRLIIIDTLAKIRPAKGSRKSQYEQDYEALAGLHAIAHTYQIAIVVAHHTRKAEAEDVFDTVSGTLGLTGAADTILVLSKKSGKVVLHARGRDIEESETALQFDGASGHWVTLGAAAEVFVSDERSRIIAVLEYAPEPMSPKELMLATGSTNRGAMDLMLLKMVRDGQISKASRGKYVSCGKTGKKDTTAEQAIGGASDLPVSANLSNLSVE
jgi:AAA domain